jgi:hypothetical protein
VKFLRATYWTFASDTEILMPYRFALLAAVATVAVAGSVHAEALKPVQARKVDLGSLAGVAYYTVEEEGHRLVVSLKAPETDTPVRFVAILAPEQAVTLSVPRGEGEPAVDVHFIRHGEQIEVKGTARRFEPQGE